MKKLLQEISKQNATGIRSSLGFAHLVITILSVVAITLLTLGVTEIEFNLDLTIVACVLLGVLALISIITSLFLYKYKK